MAMPTEIPNKKIAETITERIDPKDIPSLAYRPVLCAPNECFFKKFNTFPINY